MLNFDGVRPHEYLHHVLGYKRDISDDSMAVHVEELLTDRLHLDVTHIGTATWPELEFERKHAFLAQPRGLRHWSVILTIQAGELRSDRSRGMDHAANEMYLKKLQAPINNKHLMVYCLCTDPPGVAEARLRYVDYRCVHDLVQMNNLVMMLDGYVTVR